MLGLGPARGTHALSKDRRAIRQGAEEPRLHHGDLIDHEDLDVLPGVLAFRRRLRDLTQCQA